MRRNYKKEIKPLEFKLNQNYERSIFNYNENLNERIKHCNPTYNNFNSFLKSEYENLNKKQQFNDSKINFLESKPEIPSLFDIKCDCHASQMYNTIPEKNESKAQYLNQERRNSNFPFRNKGRRYKQTRKIYHPYNAHPNQPGGINDPFRRGLTGAGPKWYLRFLEQGLEPREARQRVENMRFMRMNSFKSFCDRVKRIHENNRFGERGMPTKRFGPNQRKNAHKQKTQEETNQSVPSKNKHLPSCSIWSRINLPNSECENELLDACCSNIQMYIMPDDYPTSVMSIDEYNKLQDIIVNEIIKDHEAKLKFDGIEFNTGMLKIICLNKLTAEWLKDVVLNLSDWSGPKLIVKDETENFPLYVYRILLRKSHTQTPERSIMFLGSQNEGLHIDKWEILDWRNKKTTQEILLSVDEDSHLAIIKANYLLFYKFYKICIMKENVLRLEEQLPENTETVNIENNSEDDVEILTSNSYDDDCIVVELDEKFENYSEDDCTVVESSINIEKNHDDSEDDCCYVIES